jgi:glycosyltransferase involved in cell wall biosynthesis
VPSPWPACWRAAGDAPAPPGRLMVVCVTARRIWTHGLGGLEEHARGLAEELPRQGHTVHVLTTSHPDGRRTERYHDATIHYLPGTPPGDYTPAWWRESRRWGEANFARLGVHAVVSISMAAWGLVGLARGPAIYTVITGWGLNQLRSYWHDASGWRRLVEFPRSVVAVLRTLPKAQALARGSALVLPVSREIERQLRRYRVHRLPAFVETAAFSPCSDRREALRGRLGFGADDCVALMAGTLTRQKGVHLGLDACAAVARDHPNLAAVVVGGGPEAQRLERGVERAAPHLRVRFTGPLPAAEVRPYYGAADVFLLPSLRQEGLPTVVLEAMAARLPVVAMRGGGTPSAVTDGETGVLVGLGDVRAFTAALRRLARDPGLRAAMGHAGHARAIREFERERVVRQLVALMSGAGC